MTINGAIMELVMLCEHPMMPDFFKPSIQKVIETISEAELVEPKDKPQILECKDEMWAEARECLEKCLKNKTEPQTEGIWNAGYKTGYDKGYKDAQKVKVSQDLVKDLVKQTDCPWK